MLAYNEINPYPMPDGFAAFMLAKQNMMKIQCLQPRTPVDQDDQGENLCKLAIFILDMAYTNETRSADQLTRRTRAAAATVNATAPDKRVMV